MARPSQNIDQRLLDAGFALLPIVGCRGLSARRLTEHAGVNLGMFHYHFRSKDNFIRTLLTQMYDRMFSMLVVKAGEAGSPVENLRNALQVVAQFGRGNRQLLLRIVADAIAGETVAAEFLRTNIPRHLGVLAGLITDAQHGKYIVQAPLPQIIAFLGGAVIAPVLLGTALLEHAALSAEITAALDSDITSEQAISQRIDFALRGLAPPERK